MDLDLCVGDYLNSSFIFYPSVRFLVFLRILIRFIFYDSVQALFFFFVFNEGIKKIEQVKDGGKRREGAFGSEDHGG